MQAIAEGSRLAHVAPLLWSVRELGAPRGASCSWWLVVYASERLRFSCCKSDQGGDDDYLVTPAFAEAV